MEPLQENKAGYASAAQREVLLGLVEHPTIRDVFFLTGGTALSVFYLGHRVSDDIDLFSVDTIATVIDPLSFKDPPTKIPFRHPEVGSG